MGWHLVLSALGGCANQMEHVMSDRLITWVVGIMLAIRIVSFAYAALM